MNISLIRLAPFRLVVMHFIADRLFSTRLSCLHVTPCAFRSLMSEVIFILSLLAPPDPQRCDRLFTTSVVRIGDRHTLVMGGIFFSRGPTG